MTEYIPLITLTPLQVDIMYYVDDWVKEERIPVPRSKIVEAMVERHYTRRAVKYSLEILLRMHYLRKAVHTADDAMNKTSYVQLRRV